MKTIALLIVILFISQSAAAVRICEDYITDEWPDSRYSIETLSGDNVVTDNKTGLMWKQCSEGLSGSDCLSGSPTLHTWQQALTSPETQNTTVFAGFADWRLPNIEELRSIAAINCHSPAINETVFPNTTSNKFWSSSPFVDTPNNAWIFDFFFGFDEHTRSRDLDYRVRLVRSGQ